MQQKRMQSKDGLLRNQNSIMQDSDGVSSSLNHMTKNLNLSWKTLIESWKFRCQQQCLVKYRKKSSVETHRNFGKRKTTYACTVDADEYTRPRLERAVHKHHQYHVAAKGTKSMTHESLVRKFIPMPQASKIPNAKAAVEKERKNRRTSRYGS